MRIVVTNFSGNVGKTTIYKHMLLPLLSAKGHEIEGLNSGDSADNAVSKIKAIKELFGTISMYPEDTNVVIDIGSSMIQSTLKILDELEDFRDSIDFWIIPAISSEKQKIDTVNTVLALREMGIEAEKIVIILNKIEDEEEIDSDFASILELKRHNISVIAGLLSSEIYEELKKMSDTPDIFTFHEAEFDFKALKEAALKTGDMELVKSIGVKHITRQKAKKALVNISRTFEMTPIYQQLILETGSSE
jgi:hypothetical protein